MKINAKNLVTRGYFFPELPPPFTSKDFGDKYQLLFSKSTLDQLSKRKPSSSECVPYAIPKAGYKRRILGVPNPLHYAALAEVLEKNNHDILKKLRSKISCSLPIEDSDRAYIKEKTFKEFQRHCFLISKECTFELKTDISRYYPTIYTHIIPWALHGRKEAKRKRNDNTLLGNIIDKYTRCLQSGQTMGIPIGPDTSLIISELIGCRLDKELIDRFPKLKSARYVDDYYFYFSSRAEAETVLNFFQTLLSEYSLSINDEKTSLREFPFGVDPEWLIELRSLKTTCFLDNIESQQEENIKQFFSIVFQCAEKYPQNEVMKFAAKILTGINISDSNWDYFEAWLIKMGLYNPYTLPEICAIFYTNRKRVHKRSVKLFVEQLLKQHNSKRHSFEVSWTLWLSKIMEIKISKTLAEKVFNDNDLIPTLLGLDLKKNGFIHKSVKTTALKAELNEESLMNNKWLLAYEATIKGWLKPKKADIKFIKSHPFFSKLEKGKVSFYDDTITQTEILTRPITEDVIEDEGKY